MSGHVSLAGPPGCRVESRTSAVLASKGYVCPVGQLQDRRLVLTEPLRNAEHMHVAQRQGGLVELPWGKKNKRPHVIHFLREHLQFRCRLTRRPRPTRLASRQTNLAKAQARRSKFAGDTWDRPSKCGDSFSSRDKQKCVRCSETHVECGVDVSSVPEGRLEVVQSFFFVIRDAERRIAP